MQIMTEQSVHVTEVPKSNREDMCIALNFVY